MITTSLRPHHRWWLVQGIIPETPYFILFHFGEFSLLLIITIIVIRINIITAITIRRIKQITIISFISISFPRIYQEQLHLQSFYGRRARRTLGSWRQRRSANCRCVSACLRGFDRNGSREPRSDLTSGKYRNGWWFGFVYFPQQLGWWSNLTTIVQRGRNHQSDNYGTSPFYS